MLEIEIKQSEINKIKRRLAGIPRGLPKVITRGINKTLASSRTKAVRLFAGDINIKQKTIREQIRILRASYSRWIGQLRFYGSSRIPLSRFAARQTQRGVSYKIEKTGGRKTAEHAFIAETETGHRGVWRRAGRARYPIYELFGPSLGAVFKNAPAKIASIEKTSAADLKKNINTQVKVLTQKANK
tara:strand:+ start:339 stop:896 length:558 start_codon:yes stop_codon:yes gene_type:complete